MRFFCLLLGPCGVVYVFSCGGLVCRVSVSAYAFVVGCCCVRVVLFTVVVVLCARVCFSLFVVVVVLLVLGVLWCCLRAWLL